MEEFVTIAKSTVPLIKINTDPKERMSQISGNSNKFNQALEIDQKKLQTPELLHDKDADKTVGIQNETQ